MKTNIEIERIAHNFTQKELASKVGVRKQTVCEWERHHRIPRIQTLVKLSSLFNKPIGYLLEQGSEKPPISQKE